MCQLHDILHTGIPCENWTCFSLFSLSIWQEIVFHATQTFDKQTHLQKQNFSETITAIDKSCMLLFDLSINPAVCCYYFFMLGVHHCLGLLFLK